MKLTPVLATTLVVMLAACSKQQEAPKAVDAAPASPTVVTVNGKAITQKTFETYAQDIARRPFAEISAEDRDQIKENLVRLELFAQDAEKTGLMKDPDLAASLEVARLQIIQQATAAKLAKEQPPTDTELRSEYDAQLAAMPLVEYRARHIVVSGEDVAQKVIERLKNGGDFASLAKQMSIQKETARNGGELGWFPPNALGPEFGQAIGLLKKGEITSTPVQTRLGWHVIQLQETRDRQPPAFDSVREQVARFVLTKKLTKTSDEMIKAAKVDPPLTTLTAPAPAAAPAAATPEAAPATAPAPAPSN